MKNNAPFKYVPQVERGCATRRAGMTYMVTDKKWFKQYPLEYFLFDPPVYVPEPINWGLSPQGISYVKKNDIVHAQDWIGAVYYPNAADILEEAVTLGASGLAPLTNQIGELTPGKSRRLLFHPAGWLHNAKAYKEEEVTDPGIPTCPKKKGSEERKRHNGKNDVMCARLHWQHITGGTPLFDAPIPPGKERAVQRKIGDTTYLGIKPLESPAPEMGLALIAWLPIDELHVVQGDDDKVAKALELLSKISDLPFFLTNA